MSVNVNSDNRVADLMSGIKRHMQSCRKCRGAVRVRDWTNLCPYVQRLMIEAVAQFDSVIPRRLAAARRGKKVFYACPDLSKHSKTYAMTAEPLVAVGVQESLF